MQIKRWNDEQLIKAIENNISYAGVLKELGLRLAGSNYDSIRKRIKQLNLDITHFKFQSWSKGVKRPRKSIDEFLILSGIENGKVNNTDLKKKLMSSGLKQHVCEECGLSEWNGQEIPLQLHHINGNKFDNRIENLQLLCPNCHALTDTYCGKNIKPLW